MYVVRAVKAEDLDGFYELAKKTGPGMTTMPAHRPSLEEKVQESLSSFAADEALGEKRLYLLVLEDLETGRIVGSSAIYAGVGLDKPFYSYRMLHLTHVSQDPEKRVDTQLLQLSNDFTGAAEVATLFLEPESRKPGLGKLLSKARYLLMAAHPDRFSDQVISEIRGWVDENERSPFWEAIGRHFFDMEFTEADGINSRGNSQFINDLMPKFPIYRSLLPKEAQDVIGRPNDGARPAIRLLEKEGFRFSGAIDIFDGGPTMEAHKRAIWSVRASRSGVLAGTVDGEGQEAIHLVAKPDIRDFRVVWTRVVETSSGYWLPEEAAKALNLKDGDSIRFVPMERDQISASS